MPMRKIINDPSLVEDQTMDGILAAFPNHMKRIEGSKRGLIRADAPLAGKVGIATGGGSGHLPLFMGYVGPGLATGSCIGNVFSSPSAEDMLEVTKAIDGGAGVLYLYGNYSGDTMNFDSDVSVSERSMRRSESTPLMVRSCSRTRLGSTPASATFIGASIEP